MSDSQYVFFKSRRGARQIRVAQTHYDLSLRRFIDETAPRLETLKLPPVPHITSPARLGPATLDGALPVQNTGYTAIGRDDDICGFQLWLIKVEAIIVALPMGRLADNRGQRGVFVIIMLGILMSLTWSLFIIARAKLPIRLACNEETRTRGLYHFYSCFIFAELIGPPIVSAAADISPWLPFIISYILLFFTFPVLVIMSNYDTAPQSPHTSHEQSTHPDVPPESRNCLRIALSATIDQFQILKFIFSTGKMRLASVIFLIGTLRGISLRALIQYTSVRFGWKLSRTNALIIEVALVNLLLFLFIMPALIRVVSIYLKPEAQVLSLGILKSSLSFLFVGSLLLAFAASSPLLIASTMIDGLGFGARSALLSLVTSWIDLECTGTLYSAVFLPEQIGMLGGEPLI
ncbi:hypothetical protein V2G26_020554 [Clonostachys chloroleuca]